VQRGRAFFSAEKKRRSFLTAENQIGAVVFADYINFCVADYMSAGQGGVRSFKSALAIHQEQEARGSPFLSKPKALLVKVAGGSFVV